MDQGHEGSRNGLRVIERSHTLTGKTLTLMITLSEEVLDSISFYTDEDIPRPQPFFAAPLYQTLEEVGWSTTGTYDILFSFSSADKTKWKIDIVKTTLQ
jgi:hypothetical protein